MTRQDIIKLYPNSTEEQIDGILKLHHNELETEKGKNKDLKNTADELKKAQEELEALRGKVNKNVPDDWESQITKLQEANAKAQQTIKDMELKTSLLGQGYGADDVDAYIKAVNEGGDIATVLGNMKKNVIAAYDKERMDKTPEAGGSGKDDPKEAEKLEAETAKSIAASIGHSSKKTNDIVNAYT